MRDILRKIRGAVGNALIWAVAWFGAGLAIGAVLYLAGLFPVTSGWGVVLIMAKTLAVPGFVTGGAFSVYLGVRHRNRHILDLSVLRLALAGGAVAAVTLVGYLVAQGAPAYPSVLLIDGAIAGGLGAVTAGGTILLSKHATRRMRDGSMEALEREQADAARLLREG